MVPVPILLQVLLLQVSVLSFSTAHIANYHELVTWTLDLRMVSNLYIQWSLLCAD